MSWLVQRKAWLMICLLGTFVAATALLSACSSSSKTATPTPQPAQQQPAAKAEPKAEPKAQPPKPLDKIKISFSSRSYAFLAGQVALEKGFFKEEGLEVEFFQVEGKTAVPATASGEVDYTMTFGTTFDSIVKGLPLRFLAVITPKPLHQIVARPEFKDIKQLEGQKIGVQRIAGSDQVAAENLLRAKGVDPAKVQFIALGDEKVRIETMKQGVVAASPLVPPGPVALQKEGYNLLAGPKDVVGGAPLAALTTNMDKIKNKPDEIKRVIRAYLKALKYLRTNKEETIQVMMSWLNQDRATAEGSYPLIIDSFSVDGSMDEANLIRVIEERKKATETTKDVKPADVADFSFLRQAQKELGLTK